MSCGARRPDSPSRGGAPAALATLLGLLAAVVLAGCAEGGKDDFDPFAAIPQGPVVRRADQAAPRWEPIASFSGAGSATKAFTVAEGAIQWRAQWRCRSGGIQLAVDPAPPNGKLLAESQCPRRGSSSAIQTGPLELTVDASGPWRVAVEQQVDTPLREPPLAGMSDDSLIARGSFYRVDKAGKGTASLYRLPDRRLALRLQGFQTAADIALFVWLSEAPRPRTTLDAVRAPHTVARDLKSTIGDQNYLLPADAKEEKIKSIVIWCQPVRNVYTAASLAPAGRRR